MLLPLAVLLLGLVGAAEAPAPSAADGALAPSAMGGAPTRSLPVQPDRFYDPMLFYGGLHAADDQDAARPEGRLVGGVVPHHNLAAELLTRFFRQLEADPPTTVIVVGPNHEARGQPVITGRRGWQTEFGVVEADQSLVDRLVAGGLATVDDETLEPEHAIGALMPYLKYHAPNAKVVPLILHREVGLPELRRLAQALAEQTDDETLLLASVDFSHYLTRVEAEAKDAQTLPLIEEMDLTALMRLGPDHIDSPGSLSVLMLAMEERAADGPHLTGHTNSGVILRSDLIETTSYFTFTYWQQ